MVNNSLKKLIDEAIIPALILIVAKIIGILASSYILNLAFEVKNASFLLLLPSIRFLSLKDYILAENYSNFAMFLAAALGSLIVILRLHFLHESHVSPKLQKKLSSLNLEKLISPSYHLYHQMTIWLIFLWLTVAFLVISTILQVTYVPITIFAVVVAANFTWITILDIDKEIEITKSQL